MKRISTLLALIVVLVCSVFAGAQAQGSPILQISGKSDTLFVCPGQGIQLEATGAASYSWSPAALFDDPTSATPTANPFFNVLVRVEAEIDGAIQRDSVFLQLANPQVSISTEDATTICRGEQVRLVAQNNVRGQHLAWSPDENLRNPTEVSILVQPDETTEYFATIDLNGCIVKDSITITVRPPKVEILEGDTVELCLGMDATLNASISGGTADNFNWSPSTVFAGDTTQLFLNITQPRFSTTYYATLVTDECTVVDSVYVRVDSLPQNTITADPEKEAYCRGDLIQLLSDTYDPVPYPGIRHTWFPDLGFETPDSLWNMVITAQDSMIYNRVTTNFGCVDTARIFIPVIQPKDITITPDEPICPGESLMLTASFEGEGEIMWEPMENISCTECKTPTVSPQQTTAYTITVTEKDCPSTQSITVQVLEPPILSINPNLTICRGESIELNLFTDPGVTYTWTSPNDPAFQSSAARPIVRPETTTTYRVVAQRDDCQPVSQDVTVTVVQPADVNLPDDQLICPGDPVSLTAEGTAPLGIQELYTWTWPGGSANGPILNIDDLEETTTFTLSYVFGPNCGLVQKTVTITVDDVPTVEEIAIDPSEATMDGVNLGDRITLLLTTDPPSPAGITYTWRANGEEIPGNGPTASHAPEEDPTTYEVTLTTANGCTVIGISPTIRVILPAFDIPNAFTPDGDGVNDFFNVVYVGNIEIPQFQVWNRWGKLVYNNDDPANGWNGAIDGNPAPADVYVYRIVVRFPDGREFNRQGDVTLIR